MTLIRHSQFTFVVIALAISLGRPVDAQQTQAEQAPAQPATTQPAIRPARQVVSANPFGLLLDLFNAEYERRVSNSATAGIGGSMYRDGDDDYVNADVFYRFYPAGKPLEGWAFGLKLGVTGTTDAGTLVGFGVDTNWSWLLGAKDNFYVGIGFGLKRLYGTDDADFGLEYIPTVRLINVGYAF